VTDKTHRRGGPPLDEPKTLDESPTARARARPYTPPTHVGDDEPDTTEGRVDRHQIEILKIWGWLEEHRKRLVALEDVPARQDGSDRPSKTMVSLRPTRARIQLENWRPTRALVVLVLGVLVLLLLAAIALASLFRH
jgi:hypothetical protein